jgi:multidrug efflux system membrane fusion protein
MKAIHLFTLAFVLTLHLAGCGSKPKPEADVKPEADAIPVRTAAVVTEDVSQSVRASGVLAGKAEAKLSFKIGGIIDRIFVGEGMTVQKGQVLATLKLSEINSQVSQAQNGFDKAERDLNRVKNLYKDSVATLEQLQDATTGFEVAKSSLSIAKFNQQYAVILAPSGGKILRKFADEGELVGAGTPVLQMNDATKGWVVRVGLADRDVVRLRLGDKATLTLDAYPAKVFEATVSEISAAASPATGTTQVELKVSPKDVAFVSGLVAKADITPSSKQALQLVPIEAVVEASGNSGSVYTPTPDGKSVTKHPINIAFIHNNAVAVSGGLDGVASVVTDGAAYLVTGSTVKIVR